MKDKSEVNINGKPALYALFYEDIRKIGLELGYAVAIHGSLRNDMDLLAIAWTEEARPYQELVKAVEDLLGNHNWKFHNTFLIEEKPHGRISCAIHFSPTHFIDLSIIPPGTKQK